MGEWRFLSPLFLLGALSVAVPVVLHLFRRRNDPVVPFSALRFLQAAPIEQARRRRLQDLLLLALRAAALLLLALGFARPYLQTPADASGVGVRVFVVDTSASMGDATRFARARALAEEAIAAAPADELVAIMRVAGTAEVLMEPGLDRGAARTTVSQLEPSRSLIACRSRCRTWDRCRRTPASRRSTACPTASGWACRPPARRAASR
jgi:hypothetical protein